MEKLITNLSVRFPDLTETDIMLSVETIINAMSTQLASGGRIELRGFGSFGISTRIVRHCENQSAADVVNTMVVPVVTFKPGLIIRERVIGAS